MRVRTRCCRRSRRRGTRIRGWSSTAPRGRARSWSTMSVHRARAAAAAACGPAPARRRRFAVRSTRRGRSLRRTPERSRAEVSKARDSSSHRVAFRTQVRWAPVARLKRTTPCGCLGAPGVEEHVVAVRTRREGERVYGTSTRASAPRTRQARRTPMRRRGTPTGRCGGLRRTHTWRARTTHCAAPHSASIGASASTSPPSQRQRFHHPVRSDVKCTHRLRRPGRLKDQLRWPAGDEARIARHARSRRGVRPRARIRPRACSVIPGEPQQPACRPG